MKRRWRLVVPALLLLGASPAGLEPPGPPGRAPLLVMVAEVRVGHARLWLRAEDPAVRVTWAPVNGTAPAESVEIRPAAAHDHTAVVDLGGLVPGVRYGYEVRAGGDRVAGSFRAAPAPDADVPVRLLWSGDLGGSGHCRHPEDGYPIFHAMRRRLPDFFLFVGDTVYADRGCGPPPHVPAPGPAASLDEFRAKHRYNREDEAVQAFFRDASVYAIWDDHEVRNNFAGPDEPLMPIGRRVFQEYFAVAGPPEEPARLYRSVRWGRHLEAFVLDTRQYRSPNRSLDGPGKSMLGLAQRRWLLEGVAMSDATWKLIVTSVPLALYTSRGAADGWSSANLVGIPRDGRTGFAHERDLILAELRARGIGNVVFVAGDVHHAELIRYQPWPDYEVHELIAGPLSARTGYPRFLDRSLRGRSLASLGFALNFGEIVADGAVLTARILDVTGTVRGQVQLTATPSRVPAPAQNAKGDHP